MIERIILLLMFCIAFMGIALKRNLIKKVYCLAVMNTAVVLFFIIESGSAGDFAPIVKSGTDVRLFVDPVPQALMLTAIVVGVCVSALALALSYRLYKKYGTLDIEEIRKASGHD